MSSAISDYPTLEAEAKAFTEAVNQFAGMDPFDEAIITEYRKLTVWETDLAERISASRKAALTAYLRITELLPDADDLFARISGAYPEAAAIRSSIRRGMTGG